MAAGSGVSARAVESEPASSSSASAVFSANGMVVPSQIEPRTTNPILGALRRHRLGQVFPDLVEETGGGEPALVGADQKRKVLGHEAGFDGIDADLLQGGREFRQR